MANRTSLIPGCVISVQEEPVPPMTTGAGVLAIVGVIKELPKTIMGAYGSCASFVDTLAAILPQKPDGKEEKSDAPAVVQLAKEAFMNGLPQLRVLLAPANEGIETSIDLFRATYPEVDMVTTVNAPESIVGEYVAKCEAEAIPVMGFFGRDFSPDLALDTNKNYVYVVPKIALGAVIGKIACLSFFESPTYKPGLIFDEKNRPEYFTSEQLNALLAKGALPVGYIPKRGWCIVKGITSDKGEISVKRITNAVVRNVKNICDMYIGELNTSDNRLALKQKIVEYLTRLANDKVLVEMEDTINNIVKPPFVVAVILLDFGTGLIKVALQIRPVRAINYIDISINVVVS